MSGRFLKTRRTALTQGAVRLDMQHPKGAPGFMDDRLKLTKGNKNAPVALICRTGNRITQVQRHLGVPQVINVRAGMAGRAAGPAVRYFRGRLPCAAQLQEKERG